MADKIPIEQAELEFERMADAMRLDLDPEDIDENDRRDFEKDKRVFLKSMMRGDLVLDDEHRPVFTPLDGEPLTFFRPNGQAFVAADKKKEGHDAAKGYAMLGTITRQPANIFAKMDYADLKVCLAVMTLFFGQ